MLYEVITPFIQYTYARIQSVLKKAEDKGFEIPSKVNTNVGLGVKEVLLIRMLANFPQIIAEAGSIYSPAVIANYTSYNFV